MNGFAVHLGSVGSPCVVWWETYSLYHRAEYKTHLFKLVAESDRTCLEADLFQCSGVTVSSLKSTGLGIRRSAVLTQLASVLEKQQILFWLRLSWISSSVWAAVPEISLPSPPQSGFLASDTDVGQVLLS